MSNEDLNQNEEELGSKPGAGSEADDEMELDDLFSDDSQEEGEDEVAFLKRKVENMEKGVRKFFSEQGRKAKQAAPVKKEEPIKTDDSDDVSEIFFEQKPQAELVQDDLKAVAKAKYSGSIVKAWKNEEWLRTKAEALAKSKEEDEVNRSKISKPSQGPSSGGKKDFSNVKSDADVEKMSTAERAAFMKAKAARGE